MIHRIVCVLSVILLLGVKLAYSWTDDSGYTQIEQCSDHSITDENGNRIEEMTPNNILKITLKENKKYYFKVCLINNGEGRAQGYSTNNYKGKIRFVLYSQSGPIKVDNFVFAEFDNQELKSLKMKEYVVPITLSMFSHLPKENTYAIKIEYFDYEKEKQAIKRGKKGDGLGWRDIGIYYITKNGKEMNKKLHKYSNEDWKEWYYIYLSDEGMKEKYKNFDPIKKQFIKPKEGSSNFKSDNAFI